MRRSSVDELDLSHNGSPPRFGELSKLLPVTGVVSTITFLYVEYVFLHCLRLLQLDMPSSARRSEDVKSAVSQLAVFHTTTALLLYCFGRCVLTHPGGIPDGRGWDLHAEADERGKEGEPSATRTSSFIEKKEGGQRRHCKWCFKYKPDRCHHCRICNTCVLRMDHHCPWVYNCIGFRNHKFFMLLLLYTGMDLCIITATMFDTVWWSTRTDVSIAMMLIMVFGYAFAVFLLVLTVTFFSFHLWLMAKAMTTVEFCEKQLKLENYDSSIYDWGLYANVCSVLGPQPLLWFLPVSLPAGDGIDWQRPGSERAASLPPSA